MIDRHRQAKELRESQNYEEALTLCNELIDENPNDATALFILGGIFTDLNRKGMAYNIFARVCKLAPNAPEGWVMYGRAQEDSPDGWEASEWCFEKSLELNPNIKSAYTNLGSLMIQKCEPKKAFPYLKKAMELDPNDPVAKSCKGFAHLMLGQWKQAWKYYHSMVGHKSRPRQEDGLPEWKGEKGATVIVDGEQGIGDEIVYASILPDLAKDCQVIYNCMPKIENLMRRSFPNMYVTGNRWKDVETHDTNCYGVKFNKPTHKIHQAGVAMYYRNKDEDFSGEPYLKADPEQCQAIRGMIESPNLKVGLAWTGGTKNSRCQFRQKQLDDFLPVLKLPNIDFYSLQYKDCDEELQEMKEKHGIEVKHFPWITETRDYDLTAALVNELDLVIAVPTSVTQLAGALGKEAWVLVPEITGWLFYREKYVWANSVRLFHNRPMMDVRKALEEKYALQVKKKIA